MADEASVQQDLKGKFVVQRKEEKTYYRYEVGGWQCRVPSTAVSDVAERVRLMETAFVKGKRKYAPDDVKTWKLAWVHNHIRAVPLKQRNGKQFDSMYKAMWREVIDGKPCGMEPETITVEHVTWNTSKVKISTTWASFESKQKRWEARLAPELTNSKKKRRKKKSPDLEADKRAVAGERVAWIQGHMRLLPLGETLGDGEFEAHAKRLYEGIFEGVGLRSEAGKVVKPFSVLEAKDQPKLEGTVLDKFAKEKEA